MKGFGQLKKLLGFGKNSVKEAKKEDKTSGLEQAIEDWIRKRQLNLTKLSPWIFGKQPDQRKMYFI